MRLRGDRRDGDEVAWAACCDGVQAETPNRSAIAWFIREPDRVGVHLAVGNDRKRDATGGRETRFGHGFPEEFCLFAARVMGSADRQGGHVRRLPESFRTDHLRIGSFHEQMELTLDRQARVASLVKPPMLSIANEVIIRQLRRGPLFIGSSSDR